MNGGLRSFRGLYCYLGGELANKKESAATRNPIDSHLMYRTNDSLIHAFETERIGSILALKAGRVE